MMDVSRFVICDPWRALALAVIRRAVADVLGEDRIAGDDVPPEVRREEALAFLHGAAAGGPEAAWFELAEVGPEEVLEVVRHRTEESQLGRKGQVFPGRRAQTSSSCSRAASSSGESSLALSRRR